jgi:hypothetical protein
MQIILPLTSTCKNQHICQINYQYNPMMTLLHLAVYISKLIKNFYYLQKFLNKQIQLRVLLDQIYACLVGSCQRLGLENVIHEPTRITSSSSTLIDPILVNNYDIVRDSYVLPNFCSDHCPSIIEINFSVTREKSC